MHEVVISGTGLYTPPEAISNEELVASFNAWADSYNREHADAIGRGELPAQAHSSVEFIIKASGIRSRYVVNKSGILDPERMVPDIPERPDDQPSVMCEMAVAAPPESLSTRSGQPSSADASIMSSVPAPPCTTSSTTGTPLATA